MARFEHGSTPHLDWPLPDHAPTPLAPDVTYFGNGRQALRALIEHRGWSRLWVPSYFCHDVTRSLQGVCDIALFEAAPFDDSVQLSLPPSEAALVMEYFGMPSNVAVEGGDVIVDRSHDPFAQPGYTRPPDYCVASLRKALPIPDGGATWSPAGRTVPRSTLPTEIHARGTLKMLTGQALKAAYLRGENVSKQDYLPLLAEADAEVGSVSTEPCAMSPWSTWCVEHTDRSVHTDARRMNIDAFREAWVDDASVEFLDTPTYVCLLASDELTRDRVRDRLIQQSVYPAVLWPLDAQDAPERHVHWSSRMMVLHADVRYGPGDMTRVARILQRAVRER